MVNKKAEGTYEDTLNKSEAFFVKRKDRNHCHSGSHCSSCRSLFV